MKYCKKCDIKVDSPVPRCPLCYATLGQLDGMPEIASYPDLSRGAVKYNMFLRILLFLSLSVNTICTTINLLTAPRNWWSLIVLSSTVYMWITIYTSLRKGRKLGFTILSQGICLSGMVMLLNYFLDTQVNWAFNYALPFLFLCATLSITIIVIIKRMAIRDFILYFVLTALLGFIPLILIVLEKVTVLWPSLVSAVYSALALASIFIFADRATKTELKKRFHI